MKNSNKIYFIAFTLILTATFFYIYYVPLFIIKLLSLMMIGAFSEFILVRFKKKTLRSYGRGLYKTYLQSDQMHYLHKSYEYCMENGANNNIWFPSLFLTAYSAS